MSLSVFYRGSKIRFRIRLSRRRFFSFVGIAAFMGLTVWQPWQYQGIDPELAKNKITKEQKKLVLQEQALKELKEDTQKRLGAMTVYLGELRAQMRRLDALGKRLAGVANLDNGEFNFNQEMPIGGPETEVAELPLSSGGDVINEIESMLSQISDKQKQLSLLESVMMNHQVNNDAYIAGRPISDGWLSSQYGIRKDPFNGVPSMHEGLDFASYNEDVEIVATGAGVVTWAGDRYGYGKLIEIDHGGGLKTRYGHNEKILVSVGDVVTRGQQISEMGSTGRSTGPHVHYEVLRNGRQIDPNQFVYRKAGSK
ncbi:M23 family metallopeptidase [Idiomarina sp. HP20-50]|uniref:M23 family metallopeptidase n=1 Tax=Idiomarina sp. HP20-50 TaxID=3070813 RepID=UPI00294B5414|nr:M23 family metallopeptidase [Idiomarina sp. HP20-50]MDV6316016.1 M23 family metallopeptidase [Idiomarina sp. HP20-50]